MADTCRTCTYFTAETERPAMGSCRRYPPVVAATAKRVHRNILPEVAATHSCGEWVQKP